MKHVTIDCLVCGEPHDVEMPAAIRPGRSPVAACPTCVAERPGEVREMLLGAAARGVGNNPGMTTPVVQGVDLPDLTPERARQLVREARCVHCQRPAIGSDETEQHVERLFAHISEFAKTNPDAEISSAVPVMWCEECVELRDLWTDLLTNVAANGGVGPTDPEVRQAVRQGIDAADVIGQRIHHEHGVPGRSFVGGATEGFLRAAAAAVKAMESGEGTVLAATKDKATPRYGPTWAGTHSMAHVREACWQGTAVEWVKTRSGEELMTPAGLVYLHGLRWMDRAHPIVVPPAQVDALPSLTHDEAYEYLRHARLPFPAVYLDFTGPTGEVVNGITHFRSVDPEPHPMADKDVEISIAGVLVYDDDDHDQASRWVVPFHKLDSGDARGRSFDYETPGAVVLNGTFIPSDAEIRMDPPMMPVHVRGLPTMHEGWTDQERSGYVLTAACGETHIARWRGTRGDHKESERRRQFADELAWLASVTWVQTVMAATVLHFLESANVDIAEAVLERRDRKRAAKRGWRTTSTVVIRHRRSKPRERRPGDPEPRNYRVRFETVGHYNHVTRGSHVRCKECRGTGQLEAWHLADGTEVPGPGLYAPESYADGRGAIAASSMLEARRSESPCDKCEGTGLDPEKVKPCVRQDSNGEPTCPNGCRREWIPPTVRGNPDAPLQVKTRRLPGA